MRRLFVLLSVFALYGCAGDMHSIRTALGTNFAPTGAVFSAPINASQNEGVLYVYRNVGYAYAPDIIVNGRNLSLLSEGAFLVDTLKPGGVEILVQKNESRGNWNFKPFGIRVTLNPGERKYIRVGAGIGGVLITPWIGGMSYQAEVREIPESIAVQELSRTRAMK
jgi:hypothetical protein